MITTSYLGNKRFSVSEESIPSPARNEVTLKVSYCGICGTDIHIYHGMMDARVNMPMPIGHEMSGIVEKVGENVEGYEIGDKVVVRPLDDRGVQDSDKGYNHICKKLKFIGIDSPGAMQQYWNVPAFTLHKLSSTIDMKLAAMIEPLAVACHDVRMSNLKEGENAVVLGGGPIGMLVAMVARNAGANVIISEVNEKRIALASELGFNVVNPIKTAIKEYVEQETNGYLADVVYEVAGVQASVDVMCEVAGIRGRIVMVAIHGRPRPVNLFQFFWKELQLIGARVYEKEDYEKAIELVTENQLPLNSLITRVRPITEIQKTFEEIDENPDGMKVLLDCQMQ